MALRERDPRQPPDARDLSLAEDVEIGLGADTATNKITIQFDRHVRALSLHPDEVIELMKNLCSMLAVLGVIVTNDGPDGTEQTH